MNQGTRGAEDNLRDREAHAVLVVEDNVELRDQVLLPGLRAFGFDPVGVGSAAELYKAVASGRFRLMVLDILLPDEDGFAIAQYLRSVSSIGIIVLTGLDSTFDRVRGLNAGADVYLAKPVDLEVLAASLHSLARRMDSTLPLSSARSVWQLEAGGWRLLAPSGAIVALSMPERLIIQRLIRSPDAPVSRDELIDQLANHIDDFDPSRLEMLVHRLRRKVSGQAGLELPLTAVRGVGYMLAFD